MSKEQLENLIDRYLKGIAKEPERELVDRFYSHLINEDGDSVKLDGMENSPVKERIYGQINRKIGTNTSSKWRYRILSAAAAIILLVSGYFFVTRYADTAPVNDQSSSLITLSAGTDQHSILLNDGTYVLLSPGATLTYPEIFEDDFRKVSLKGEAWFDVQHDEDRPFKVFSNEVVTTVLGTSFSINADTDGKDVEVKVTSGRVKVNSEQQELAVLEKDDQLIYRAGEVEVSRQVNNQEMEEKLPEPGAFKLANVTMAEAADFIEKRWGKEITFENIEIEKCPLYASFNADDPLEEVLMVVCGVSNSKYKLEKEKIIIYGPGCLRE